MSSQIKRLFGIFVYVIVVLMIFLWLLKYQAILLHGAKQTFDPFPHQIFSSLYPIGLGLLFALPNFISNLKVHGRWKVDWIKLIAVGTPALYFANTYILYFSPIGMHLPFADYAVLYGGDVLPTVSGIVFGYIILNSMGKVNQ